MKHLEFNWKSSDGLDIFARGWSPDTTPPKAVICLVHGIGEHTLRYLHVAEFFTGKGYVLFGADLRGHGKSGGPRGHFPSIEAVLGDIDMTLEQARLHYPGVPLFIYGHSLGGILVLNYVLKRNPDVKGAIVTSPGLHTAVEEQPVKVLAARILGSLFPAVTLPTGLDADAITRDGEVVNAYKRDPLVHNRMSLGFGKTMLKVIHWTLEHAGEFSRPLLLMHGMKDSIAYPSSSTEVAASLNEKCKLVMWEGGYHELHNEPFKEEVFNTMTSWIEKQ